MMEPNNIFSYNQSILKFPSPKKSLDVMKESWNFLGFLGFCLDLSGFLGFSQDLPEFLKTNLYFNKILRDFTGL